MLWKQLGRGNVVTQFLPNELKFNATPTQKDDLSEMPGFLSRAFYRDVLTILVYGQASTLSDSITKMFLLCLFADFICKNGLET